MKYIFNKIYICIETDTHFKHVEIIWIIFHDKYLTEKNAVIFF